MPLADPPSPAELTDLAAVPVAGQDLARVYKAGRDSPWWFASRPAQTAGMDPADYGRFDLEGPNGSCYLGTSVAAATLEALQEHSRGILPVSELAARRLAVMTGPPSAPAAADLTRPELAAKNITAALWAGEDRARTQRWADALFRAGWRALHHGIQHDPGGQLRAVTLFDTSGEHPPWDDPAWTWETRELTEDPEVAAALAMFGFTVVDDTVDLPVVALGDYLNDNPA